ncbi:MAG: hypothetical protein EA403_07180 [Spirochaetaceae bacterium]|nr:MAG: hypothetical protein EA403_07180 [Spirochaetaceae bacterium]
MKAVEMAAIEELINLIITFAFVAAPLWILLSRRKRAQEQRRGTTPQQPSRTSTVQRPARASQGARSAAETAPAETDELDEHLDGRREAAAEVARRRSERDLSVRQAPTRIHRGDDGGYTDRRQEQAQQMLKKTGTREDGRSSAGDPAAVRKPSRIEAVLRELLGLPDEAEQRAREQERQAEQAKLRAEKAAKKRPVRPSPSAEPFVARAPDVVVRSVMPASGSLSLSPGGMGSQQMRTAAGNLGASSSAEKTPPVPHQLGRGWRRIGTLPEFKRAILLSEVLGKPHSLKDLDA